MTNEYEARLANEQEEHFAEAERIERDGFDAWAAASGELPTTEVEGAEAIAVQAKWDRWAAEGESKGTCEHGLAAWLCAGPMHYPADDVTFENSPIGDER